MWQPPYFLYLKRRLKMNKETYKIIVVGNGKVSEKYFKDIEKIGKKVGFCTGLVATIILFQQFRINKLEKRLSKLEKPVETEPLEETPVKE